MDKNLKQFIEKVIDQKMSSMTNMAIPFSRNNGWDTPQLDPAISLDGWPVIQIIEGVVLTVALNAAGTGYAVKDILNITAGDGLATVTVLTIGGGGAITSIQLVNGGSGYAVAAGLATTTSGLGTGATINVATLRTAATAPTDIPTQGTFRFYIDIVPNYYLWAYLVYQNAMGVLVGTWKKIQLT